MVNFISIRELRPKLSDIINNVHKRFDRYIVTKRGKPEVVIMSIDDYESILETLDIESDKGLMKRIKRADMDMIEGKGVSLDDLKKDMGLV